MPQHRYIHVYRDGSSKAGEIPSPEDMLDADYSPCDVIYVPVDAAAIAYHEKLGTAYGRRVAATLKAELGQLPAHAIQSGRIPGLDYWSSHHPLRGREKDTTWWVCRSGPDGILWERPYRYESSAMIEAEILANETAKPRVWIEKVTPDA